MGFCGTDSHKSLSIYIKLDEEQKKRIRRRRREGDGEVNGFLNRIIRQ